MFRCGVVGGIWLGVVIVCGVWLSGVRFVWWSQVAWCAMFGLVLYDVGVMCKG